MNLRLYIPSVGLWVTPQQIATDIYSFNNEPTIQVKMSPNGTWIVILSDEGMRTPKDLYVDDTLVMSGIGGPYKTYVGQAKLISQPTPTPTPPTVIFPESHTRTVKVIIGNVEYQYVVTVEDSTVTVVPK